jgi:hypothetical protein
MSFKERAALRLEAGDDIGVERGNIIIRPIREFGIVPAKTGDMWKMLGGFEGCISC